MCDRSHYIELRDRVDRLEGSVAVHHAQADERFKTLFATCEKLSDTATTILRTSLALIGFVIVVTVLALVYGALGHDGFNAVSASAYDVNCGSTPKHSQP